MSGTGLRAETAHAVDAQVAAAQAAGRVPALAAAVVREGAVAHLAGAGDPVGPQVQFRIGPITKTLTAVLVLQLRDEGRLALDDLLYRHLPGTAVGTVTLRQLLGHAAGLQREPGGPARAAGSWRFTRENGDRWRGTAGENDGEVLLVRRDPDGTVVALEVTAQVLNRDPEPPDPEPAGKPAAGKPAGGKPAGGKPAGGKPAGGKPHDRKQVG